MNTIGPDDLKALPWLRGAVLAAPEVPFSDDLLKEHGATHILVYTPATPGITLVAMRDIFGMDPAEEPCMYNQDWYLNEQFANRGPDGKWHLVRKEVLEAARTKRPEDIEATLSNEIFPSAITAAFTFFAWYALKGETLWKHDFLWCADRDHNGDRIYVGRYEDPTGVNKKGFNVHRHLALRPAYSAAPEIVS